MTDCDLIKYIAKITQLLLTEEVSISISVRKNYIYFLLKPGSTNRTSAALKEQVMNSWKGGNFSKHSGLKQLLDHFL